MKLRKYYSQAGQDKWVVENVFDHKTGGYFLDIGAYDGVRYSNTFWLEKNLGWSGLCVEADADTFQKLQSNRQCLCKNACVGLEGAEVIFETGKGPYSHVQQDGSSEESDFTNRAKMRTQPLWKTARRCRRAPMHRLFELGCRGF